MPLSKDDYLIIIRAAGERTERLCHKLAQLQGYPENVVMVKEVPFHKSLVKGFEIALEYNHRWTFCVDADCLLGRDVVKKSIESFENMGKDIFRSDGMMISKFQQAKLGGFHCYLTSTLKEAKKYFNDAADNLKPETYISRRMMQDGHKFEKNEVLAGLHEYYLSYNDLYRRYRLRGTKASVDELKLVEKNAKRLRKEDDDFKVILKALKDSRKKPLHSHSKDAISDEEISEAISGLGLVEKDNIEENAGFEYVDRIIDNFETPEESLSFEQFFWGNMGKAKPENLGNKRYVKQYSIFDRIKNIFGI